MISQQRQSNERGSSLGKGSILATTELSLKIYDVNDQAKSYLKFTELANVKIIELISVIIDQLFHSISIHPVYIKTSKVLLEVFIPP